MAADSSVNFSGIVDVGAVLAQMSRAMPDSPLIKDFFTQVAQPLVDQMKGAKLKGLSLDLSKMFGLDSKLTKTLQANFHKATNRLINAVQKQVDQVKNIKVTADFDLEHIIGATPKFNKQTKERYQGAIDRYLGKVGARLKGANLTMAKIDLRSLLGATPIFSRNTRLSYQKIVNSILSSLDKGAANLNLSGHIDISSLIGGTPEHKFRVRREYRQLISRVFGKLTDELGAVKFSEEGLTLASLIGQTPQFTIYSHVQYERVVKDILRKITKGLQDRTEPLLHAAPITLTEIIGQTPRLAIYSRSQYERLVYNVFHKLKSQVSDKTSLTSEPIKLRDLIGSTPQFTFWTNRSYQQLIRKVLGKIGENISKITVANKNFDLASLIGKTPEFGFWAKLKFQSIIWKVLGSVESGLKGQGMSLSFDLSKLFIGEELSTNSKKRFKTAINKLISKIDGASVVDLNLASLLGGQPKQNRPGGFQSDLNQENDVVVADFLPGALGKLKHFFGVPSHDSATLAGIHHVKGESNTSWIGKIAAALLAALVASGISIYLAINGMLDNGPLKGLKKLGYQVAHWASKFFYSLAKKVFQFGMKFKGLGGLAKSIITKIESPFKKIGTFLTEHVGGAFRSFFGKIGSSIGKVLKGFLPSLFGSTSAIATKILPKLGSGVFGGISKWLGKFFTKKAATKIPFGIGTVIGLGFAFSRFKDGDWIGGLLDTASAIASAYPGVGTAIAIAIDVFSAARDLKTGGSEAVGKANGNGNLMGKLWGWLKTKWPLAGWILAGEGIKEIFGGNFRSGFTKLDAGLLNTSFGWILDIFGVDQNKTASIIDNSASTVGDFFGSVVNWISSSAPIKWMGKVSSGLFKLLGLDVKSGLQDLDAAGIPFMGSILSFFNNIPNIPDMMNNAVDTTYDFFTGLASTISNKIHDFISSAINWVTDHIPGFNLIKSGWGWLTGSSNNKPEARPTNLSRPNIKAIEKPEVPIITAKVDSTAMAEIKKGLDDHTKEMASMSLFIQQLLSEFKNAGKDIGIIADNSKIRPTNNSQANQSSMKPPLDTATVRDHIFEKRREYRSA